MITVINPAFLSIIVDNGRFGYGYIGVAPSSGLDRFACAIARFILGNPDSAPVLETMGNDLSLLFSESITFAITGARVKATLDDVPVQSWSQVKAPKGSILKVSEILEGLRYYLGFSGIIDIDPVMGSCSTNLECRFGGFQGRPLMKGDVLKFRDLYDPVEHVSVPDELIPSLHEPHILRVLSGPEADRFNPASVKFLSNRNEALIFKASARLNRTGIRLEGPAIQFRDKVEQSIMSEGILPGTIQVPPDGLPIINCVERTIGGYARLGIIIDVDLDKLAHIKPFDRVILSVTDNEEAERLLQAKKDTVAFYVKKQ
ncbi:MAG: KipI antagonist [Deltaproteobacteria bacterium]|nr:KipI antagonist [Deltaproteobacteria bacterium]